MALQQTIAFSDQQIRVNADGTLALLTVTYDSKDSETNAPITSSTSFGSGLYFNSNQLTLQSVTDTDIHPEGLNIPNTFPAGSRDDESNNDNDPTTDQFFLATWSDADNWQTVGGTPSSNFDLYTAFFDVAPGVNLNDLTLNFVAKPANLATDPVTNNTFTIVTNAIPTVGAQNFSIPRLDIPANNNVFTSVTVTDTDDALNTLTVKISGGNFDTDGDGNLAFAENLSFANDTWNIIVNDKEDLTPETVKNFGLTVQATDIFQESSTGVTSVTITDVPPPEPPVVTDKSLTILGNEITKYNKLAQGDFLTSVDITDDKDISNLTVKIANFNQLDGDGDGNSAFAENLTFANGTWNIVVNDADDLNFAASQGYDLEIQATDEDSLSGTGPVALTITDKFQRINVIPDPLRINPDGSPLEFTVQYESSDPTLGSFGLGLYFDSNVLDLQPLQPEDVLEQNRAFPNGFPADSRDDESDLDQDETTNQLFLASWSDSTQNWPGSTPVDLYNVTFDVVGAVNDGTPINFTASPAQGFVADVPRFNVTTGPVNRDPVFVGEPFGPFTIKEASPVGTQVGTVTATDPDGDTLTYSIIGGNTDVDGDGILAFKIESSTDSSTGLITVNDSDDLVFATQPNFGLTIQVTDPFNASDTTAVTVNLDRVEVITNGVVTFDKKTTITLASNVTADATLDNKLVYYKVDDAATGAIDGVLPGQTGYLAKALMNTTDVLLRGGSGSETTTGEFGTKTLEAGSYAPMLIANSGKRNNLRDLLEVNASNTFNGDIRNIVAYFAYGAASADGENHFQFNTTTRVLSVEDLHSSLLPGGEPGNGGAWDFNDLKAAFTIV